MDEIRANPDEILHRIKKESNIESRGHLKIFFGYAAGVGKIGRASCRERV